MTHNHAPLASLLTLLALTVAAHAQVSSPLFPGLHYPVGNNPGSLAIGDLNGDGQLDVATADLASNTVSVLKGDGLGNFSPHVSFPVFATKPQSIAIGDMNN